MVVVLATSIHPTETKSASYSVLSPCVLSDAISTLPLWALSLFVHSGMLEIYDGKVFHWCTAHWKSATITR